MSQENKLSSHLEDYLEAIADLSSKNNLVRPSNIAEVMNVKKPSVTGALNALSEKGLIEYEKYKPVSLTKDGKALAENIRKKHELLSDFFTKVLNVDATQADIAACKMEHSLEDGIMKKLVRFLKNTQNSMCSSCASRSKKCTSSCPHARGLDTLKVGDRAVVLGLDSRIGDLGVYAGMGLTIGASVEVVRVALLGDPVIIRTHGSEISMRKSQLKCIKVKLI